MTVVTISKGSRRRWRVIFSIVVGLGLGLYVSWVIDETVLQWPTLAMPLLFGGVAYLREVGGRRRQRPGAPAARRDPDRC